jgi:hypothetical protein
VSEVVFGAEGIIRLVKPCPCCTVMKRLVGEEAGVKKLSHEFFVLFVLGKSDTVAHVQDIRV